MRRKRNIMGTAAAVLLYMVLLTSYMLSGLMARFVAAAENGDSARAAKYGVIIHTEGNVLPSGETLMPGMEGMEGMVISLEGTPETAVSTGGELKTVELCLPEGYYHVNYGDRTISYMEENDHVHSGIEEFDNYHFCIQVKENYYPLQYTVYEKAKGASDWSILETEGEKQENLSAGKLALWLEKDFGEEFAAHADLTEAGQWKITCGWPKNDSNDETAKHKSFMDTLLLEAKNMTWIDESGKETKAPEGFADGEQMEFIFEINQKD